jgi:uncharacterized phosphosugar-binding protein
MFVDQYYQNITGILETIYTEESVNIKSVGKVIAEVFKNDQLLHVFGCGHSHMLEEELFYRAGGMALVNPIFETSTMLHEGAVKSSQIERMSGYAHLVLERYSISPGDAILIASTSGINSFPIEMAQSAKEFGATVIGITSFYYLERPSRQADGLHLKDVCDYVINNHVPVGDASVEVRSDGTKSGPLSSIATLFIANSLMLAASDQLNEWNIEPKIYQSGNCPGGDQYNARLISQLRTRIKHL